MAGVIPKPPAEFSAVGDRQIDLVRLDDVLQVVGDDPAAGRAENVADEKYVH